MGAGGALANVSFYPPEKQNTWIYTIQHLLHPKGSFLPPCQAGHGSVVITRGCPGVSRGALPGEQDGEGLGVILPWQGHTAEHTLALPMLLPQKLN